MPPQESKINSNDAKLGFLRLMDLPGGSVVENPPANAGDVGSIPGWGRFPGVEK